MSTTARWTATRLIDKPIVSARSDPSIGVNIQGPSPIRVPDWIDEPLGKYYLYFADHKGSYIRLAYSDRIEGPWTIHVPGSLHLRDSHFPTVPPQPNGEVTTSTPMKLPHSSHKEYSTPHIASPDVHIDDDNQRMVMYFHGLESYGRQLSRVATSKDGIDFDAYPETIGPTYLRAFTYKNELFAMTMPGQFFHSSDGFKKFEPGPRLFNSNMRHSALLVENGTLHVFWTQVYDAPERILVSTIDLNQPFEEWVETDSYELLRPEREWEGAKEPVEPSIRSVAYGSVCQLRDPAILVDDEQTYLFYAAGGESCIGVAALSLE
ncbi:MAG: hypothetical protein F4X44_11380 [Gammaproteobacteria bacterium]|nr:hypothetical protein [Gammaproteobacteria bacterium]